VDKKTYEKLVEECQKDKKRKTCEGCPDFWAQECPKGKHAVQRWIGGWR